MAIATIYCAILFVDPSDIVSLTHTSLIMTAILAKIFLKEKLTIAHFIGILLTAAGVIFITQPSFIFASNPSISNISLFVCNKTMKRSLNENLSDECAVTKFNKSTKTESTQFGIVLTLIAAFLVSCTYLVIKKLTIRKVNWATNNIFVSLIGLPLSVISSILFIRFGLAHVNFAAEKKDLPMDLFYSILAALLANVAQIFLNLALQYEDTTKIAITKTTDVFAAFILQFLLLDIKPDLMSILGAFLIILATCFVLVYKLLYLKYEQWIAKNTVLMDPLEYKNDEPISQQAKQNTLVISDKIELKKRIILKNSIKNYLLKLFFFQI